MRAFVCGVCVSVKLTCESSEMEFDATVEVADEWLTVEALDTAAVAVHAQHSKHAKKKIGANTDTRPHEKPRTYCSQ